MPSFEDQTEWFADKVQPHEPFLRGYLRKRFPSVTDHDDIVQESYVRVLRSSQGTQLSNLRRYLVTIARNLAIDTLRHQRASSHEPISDSSERSALEVVSGIPDSLERQRRSEVLVEAIAALPERCREVVMLRHLEGLAYKDIAVRLGISPNTVRIHIVKGMKDCTAFFQARGLLERNPSC